MRGSKRRTFYVDRDVQFELGKRIVFHWICFIGVTLFLVSALQFLMGNPFQSFSSLMNNVFEQYGIVLCVMLALIPVFVYDTIKVSNRFAGPMLRFRRAITSLADGEDLKPIYIRKGDMWSELADEYNRMLERFSSENPSNGDTEGESDPTAESAAKLLNMADESISAELNDESAPNMSPAQ